MINEIYISIIYTFQSGFFFNQARFYKDLITQVEIFLSIYIKLNGHSFQIKAQKFVKKTKCFQVFKMKHRKRNIYIYSLTFETDINVIKLAKL